MTDRDAEKRKLQHINAYGHELGTPSHPPAAASAPRARSEAALLHEQISQEIAERQEFVSHMRAAGNTEHEAAMQQQIAERMGELQAVERHMQGPK